MGGQRSSKHVVKWKSDFFFIIIIFLFPFCTFVFFFVFCFFVVNRKSDSLGIYRSQEYNCGTAWYMRSGVIVTADYVPPCPPNIHSISPIWFCGDEVEHAEVVNLG